MVESFSRQKSRHAPQKEGGLKILCDLPPVWPRLVRPTNLMSRMDGKKTQNTTWDRFSPSVGQISSFMGQIFFFSGTDFLLLRDRFPLSVGRFVKISSSPLLVLAALAS